MNRFGNPLRLIPVNRIRSARSNGTESTTSCARIAEDHKRSRACSPTLTHVRTITTLANCVQSMTVDKIANVFVIFADREFYPKPIGFFGFGGFCYFVHSLRAIDGSIV